MCEHRYIKQEEIAENRKQGLIRILIIYSTHSESDREEELEECWDGHYHEQWFPFYSDREVEVFRAFNARIENSARPYQSSTIEEQMKEDIMRWKGMVEAAKEGLAKIAVR